MKTFVALIAVTLTSLASFVPSSAHAAEGQVSSILYNCNVSFSANGRSIYLGIGYSEIDGKGTISCYDFLTGATQHIPIKVKARGPGVGLGVTGLNLSGGAAGIGLTTGPEALLGRYGVVRGNAAVGIGAAASTGLRLSKDGITLSVNIEAQNGLGAGVDLLFVELSADGEKTVQPAAASAIASAATPTPAPAAIPVPAPSVAAPTATLAPATISVQLPSSQVQAEIIYVEENQPIQILDPRGRVLKVLMLRPRQ